MIRIFKGGAGRSSRFWNLLPEGFVIVISVLVALVAEGWRSEWDARADVEAALRSLDREVVANLQEIEEFMAVARARYDRLVQVGDRIDGSRPFADHVSEFGGFRVPDLQFSSWSRVGSDPGVWEYAPDRLAGAFMVYRDLSFLSGLDQHILAFTLSPDYHDEARAEVAYRIAEEALSQQVAYAENAAARLRAFLDGAPGES